MQTVVGILIRNSEGDYFVHQRSAEKKYYPGYFGLGAGGRVEPNETPSDAAIRELEEETGIRAIPTFLFAFEFTDGEINHVIEWYTVTSEAIIFPIPLEWQWSGWVTEEEVEKMSAQGKLCPDTAIFFDRYRELGLNRFDRDAGAPTSRGILR